ncbi:MAG: C3HC zinc finger-like-domain-containing protein [Piptocephalis tieghemiana]|nr:MAG: C3HC zinc finger-like-domain-containing protein [Piptocephalis tieghemiana]
MIQLSERNLLQAAAALDSGSKSNFHPPAPTTPPSPLYRPHLLSDLLGRIATFRVTTYVGKPPELSPIVCSRHGWTNSAHDTLLCLTCGAQLYMDLDGGDIKEEEEEEEDDDDDDSISGLVRQLTTSHQENCPWRKAPCPEDLYSLSTMTGSSPLIILTSISLRALRLEKALLVPSNPIPLPPNLPIGPHLTLDGLNQLANHVTAFVRARQGPGAPHPDASARHLRLFACQLALYGWEAPLVPSSSSSNTNTLTLHCPWCLRSLPLPQTYQQIVDEKDEDPLLDEHRAFCPHLDPTSGWTHSLAISTAPSSSSFPLLDPTTPCPVSPLSQSLLRAHQALSRDTQNIYTIYK